MAQARGSKSPTRNDCDDDQERMIKRPCFEESSLDGNNSKAVIMNKLLILKDM